ncbi:MAG: tRNA pseudouridine(38-40) synthase TruA [Promethearchaeota archaeon]
MPEKNKYTLFKVYYFGEHYHGSQRQPKLPTIEGKLLNALNNKGYLSDEHYKDQIIHSAGRTDAGVHSRGMTYGFYTQRDVFYPIEVNTSLPEEIIIWSSGSSDLNDDNSPKVHPRYQALQRHYKYFFLDSQHVLNLDIVHETIDNLTGTHDFRNFSKFEQDKNTVRTVDQISVETVGNLWIFDFKAKSFLWNQIRKMVRVIIQIGSKQWLSEVLISLFNPRDLKYALKVEPVSPNGLILWDVTYPSHMEFQHCKKSIQKLNSHHSSWVDELKIKKSLLDRINDSFQ